MTDDKAPNDKTIFDHPAFDYEGGAKMKEFRGGDGWLPYFERWVVVIWLYGLGLVGLDWLDLFSRFTRFWVVSVGIAVVLVGMHVAFVRSGRQNAVLYKDRQRRRYLTGVISTLWILVWVGLVYAVWG